ncbi:MAG: RDD family protein [Chlamydiales bacterium]
MLPDSTMQYEQVEYAGFWRRFGAFWLDLLVLLPLLGISLWLAEKSRLSYLYIFLPSQIISFWFHVYLVKHFGGTPGKLLLGIRIARLDGAAMDYQAAFLRYSVTFLISVSVSIGAIVAVLKMTDADYFSLDIKGRSLRIGELAPIWYKSVTYLNHIWMWSEFLVMMTNRKRRALHDFIAGTIVIKTATKVLTPSSEFGLNVNHISFRAKSMVLDLKERLGAGIWLRISNSNIAEKAINQGIVASGLMAAGTIIMVLLNKTNPVRLVDTAIFSLTGWGLYKKSRTAAIIGLAYFLSQIIFILIVEGYQRIGFGPIILLMLINSVRGTIGFHKYKTIEEKTP